MFTLYFEHKNQVFYFSIFRKCSFSVFRIWFFCSKISDFSDIFLFSKRTKLFYMYQLKWKTQKTACYVDMHRCLPRNIYKVGLICRYKYERVVLLPSIASIIKMLSWKRQIDQFVGDSPGIGIWYTCPTIKYLSESESCW